MRRPKALALAAALALPAVALPAVAEAATARASGHLALRAGPSTSYAVVGELAKGERVEIDRCTRQARWCYVVGDDYEGWARGSYLIGSAAKVEATPFEFLVNPFRFGFGD